MSHLILFGCWSLNSVGGKRKWFHYLKNDGTWTEIIAGIIPGRQGCYFYSSDSMYMYIIYCCAKKKKKSKNKKKKKWKKRKKRVLLSIKNDTQHHWDPMQKSAVTISPIIHKTPALKCYHLFFFLSLSLPQCTLTVVLILLLPLGTVALMSWLISQGSDARLHLVFTVKLIAHVCRPCSGPALPGEAVWPRLECQTLWETCDPGRCHYRENKNIICMFLRFVDPSTPPHRCHYPWTVCHSSSFRHDLNIKYWDSAGISISLFALQPQLVTADLKIIALLNITAIVPSELNELGNLFPNSI